jgi:hypothetical protein
MHFFHGLLALGFWGCAAAPRPTATSLALAANARATIEGRVLDRKRHPVSGIAVQALPRGKDIGWSPPAVTDAEGRFRLSLLAPAEYGFLLRWRGRTVVTPGPDDPARRAVAVNPGDHREGIELLFLSEEWQKIP